MEGAGEAREGTEYIDRECVSVGEGVSDLAVHAGFRDKGGRDEGGGRTLQKPPIK